MKHLAHTGSYGNGQVSGDRCGTAVSWSQWLSEHGGQWGRSLSLAPVPRVSEEIAPMELRHLRYFIAAADEAHFGRAAERLFVTRPAVSQTIADLEAELGVQLFVRNAQKVALTAAGVALQKNARILLQELSQAIELTKRIGQGKAGLLRLGYGSLSLLHPLFRAAVKQLGKELPDIELSLQELPSSDQVPAISAGKLDAGFVYLTRDAGARSTMPSEITSLGDLNSLKIQEGGLAVALPPDHPLADRDSLELGELQQENFVVVPRSTVSPSYGRLSSMCLELGFSPRVVQEVANIATQINLISVGIGVGLVVSAPRLQYPSSIKVVPLHSIDYLSEFNLAWRRGPVEPSLQHLIDIVRQLARAEPRRAHPAIEPSAERATSARPSRRTKVGAGDEHSPRPKP